MDKKLERVKKKLRKNAQCASWHVSANGVSAKIGWVYDHVTSGQSLSETGREGREVSNKIHHIWSIKQKSAIKWVLNYLIIIIIIIIIIILKLIRTTLAFYLFRLSWLFLEVSKVVSETSTLLLQFLMTALVECSW